MPIFRNIFNCRSNDNNYNEETKHNIQRLDGDIDDVKERLNRLEIKYDSVKDILNIIKMDIKLINMNIQNALQQRKD